VERKEAKRRTTWDLVSDAAFEHNEGSHRTLHPRRLTMSTISGRKKLSRREFLRLAGVGTAISASGILAACVPVPAEQAAAPASQATTVPAPTAAPAAASSGGKTVVLAIQEFAHPAVKTVTDVWEQQTGNKVQLESGPASGEEMVTKYAPAFQSGTSPVDVLSVDEVSGPAFARAGWMAPLDDVIPAATWADFPTSMLPPVDQDPFHSYNGKRYRVPHEFAVGYFWYRKDWFDENKTKVPTTWDEFVQVGKEYTKGQVMGTTEGMKKPGLTFVYLAYLAAQTGGDVFAFDDKTAQAFQFAYDLIYTHKIMSDTVLNQDYTQQNDLYMKDRVAMMRQWPYFWGVLTGNTAWWKDGKAAIALPPAGPAGSKTWYGGWGWGLPAKAPNMPEAQSLIAWVSNNQNAPILAKGQSWFIMPRKSILDAMPDDQFVKWMNSYIEANILTKRPYNVRQADCETAVDDVGQLYLTKQMSLADAMKTGQQRIAALG
jgi:ABC-type glycerol-3-phosphate transport system substrate-binding protein